ncbi:MAG: hypothetical protein KDN18_11570 [Verrucomicrobiae bacterium]|nr:hypothetical protein [Verrucomicrobiae bacterium]
MNPSFFYSILGASALALLVSCGKDPSTVEGGSEPSPPSEALVTDPNGTPDSGDGEKPIIVKAAQQRQLTEEEQKRVLEGVFRERARQQAAGLGGGKVVVNGAWPYSGYSTLAPDPAAAIEARLVAVDITVSGHTPYFDIDDIEIVDGASLVSYGSDPHAEPLQVDGSLLPQGEAIPIGPAPSRWLLIYAFPKATPRFHLYYWGKALTAQPVAFGEPGLSLPYPPSE